MLQRSSSDNHIGFVSFVLTGSGSSPDNFLLDIRSRSEFEDMSSRKTGWSMIRVMLCDVDVAPGITLIARGLKRNRQVTDGMSGKI